MTADGTMTANAFPKSADGATERAALPSTRGPGGGGAGKA